MEDWKGRSNKGRYGKKGAWIDGQSGKGRRERKERREVVGMKHSG